jgi:hypothetical protein
MRSVSLDSAGALRLPSRTLNLELKVGAAPRLDRSSRRRSTRKDGERGYLDGALPEGGQPALPHHRIHPGHVQVKHLTNIIKRKDWREPIRRDSDPARGARCNGANGGRPTQGEHRRVGTV